MRLRRALVCASLSLLGCSEDPRAPFDLDDIIEPRDDCVEVVHEALEIGTTIHAFVADGLGSAGGWALASINDENGISQVVVVRVPASTDEPGIAPVELGLATLSIDVSLRAGAVPGEAWVLQDSGNSAVLRKLVPGIGVAAVNGSIANFPPAEGGGCPDHFIRELVLIEGRPYLLALPDCSDSTALDLQLLELDPESLLFTSSWVLGFDPCVDDPQCANFVYTLGPIRGGEASPVANADRIAVGFSQVRDFGVGLTSTDVSLLELRFVAGDPAARLVTFRQVWLTPTSLDRVHLAQDPFSVQLHVRNASSEEDAALLRFDAIGELYIQIKTPQLLPFDGRGRLFQLTTQSAMIDVRDGALELIPLVDIESWPTWSRRTMYELDDLLAAEPAGVGHLLLRRAESPPQIIALRCTDSE